MDLVKRGRIRMIEGLNLGLIGLNRAGSLGAVMWMRRGIRRGIDICIC